MGLRKRRRSGCWRAGSAAAEAEDVGDVGDVGDVEGGDGGAATTEGGGAVIVADAEAEVDA